MPSTAEDKVSINTEPGIEDKVSANASSPSLGTIPSTGDGESSNESEEIAANLEFYTNMLAAGRDDLARDPDEGNAARREDLAVSSEGNQDDNLKREKLKALGKQDVFDHAKNRREEDDYLTKEQLRAAGMEDLLPVDKQEDDNLKKEKLKALGKQDVLDHEMKKKIAQGTPTGTEGMDGSDARQEEVMEIVLARCRGTVAREQEEQERNFNSGIGLVVEEAQRSDGASPTPSGPSLSNILSTVRVSGRAPGAYDAGPGRQSIRLEPSSNEFSSILLRNNIRSEHSPTRTQEEDPESHQRREPDVLLSATLVPPDLEDPNVITHSPEMVEAKPALEGFRAIVNNKRFKFVLVGFVVLLLAVVIPVALQRNGQTNSGATAQVALVPGIDCATRATKQEDYRGTIAVTETGEVCQRWDSQEPHTHNYDDELYVSAGLDENYCRNPGGESPRTWCYPNNASSRWSWCNVPYCDGKPYNTQEQQDCGTLDLGQADYRGNISVTATGKECQAWDANEPHVQDRKSHRFPNADLKGNNFCRNPDGATEAWCYTKDNNTRYEVCDITPCGVRRTARHHNKTCTGKNCTVADCGTESLQQSDYRGTINTTAGGYTCQPWDSQFPHAHGKTSAVFPKAGLDENYCRNPDGTASIWCYTTDPDKVADLCEVPYCPVNIDHRRTCGSLSIAQNDYRGAQSTTVSGFDCLQWMFSAEASSLGFTPDNLPEEGLFGAYCRNPSSSRSRAWCFVDHPNATSSWEYCDVGDCKECGTPSIKKEDYRGKQDTTESGNTCLNWADRANELFAMNLTMDYLVLEANNCRNPEGYREDVWCFVEGNATTAFEFCAVNDCAEVNEPTPQDADPETCGSLTLDQADYRGPINTTMSGLPCQSWGSQTPHSHKYTNDINPENGLERNYCRNPDSPSTSGAWCYTTDPATRWERCTVPSCEVKETSIACGTISLKQSDYRGTVNTTVGGYACQPWESQTPHPHRHDPANSPWAGLEEAYCRNPDGSERVWCYTMNASKPWDYCDIPICY